jgi:cytidylate kinase
MIITIDGPVATGKSTIAKRLAEKLNFIFFDTGAMYRCLTYALVNNNIDIDNPAAVSAFLENFSFDVITKNGEKRYLVNHEDVTEKIRSESITSLVSKVSALTSVREKLVALQRSLAVDVDAVFEGRDMGTVVFPKADLKIFLWGNPEVRAKRRFDELRIKFPKDTENLTLEQTIAEINRRDTYDSTRQISPLKQAQDAYLIDTSDLTLDQVVLKILELKVTRSQ